MKISTAALTLRYPEAEGVEYIFGVPGTTMVPVDAVSRQSKCVRRE